MGASSSAVWDDGMGLGAGVGGEVGASGVSGTISSFCLGQKSKNILRRPWKYTPV